MDGARSVRTASGQLYLIEEGEYDRLIDALAQAERTLQLVKWHFFEDANICWPSMCMGERPVRTSVGIALAKIRRARG